MWYLAAVIRWRATNIVQVTGAYSHCAINAKFSAHAHTRAHGLADMRAYVGRNFMRLIGQDDDNNNSLYVRVVRVTSSHARCNMMSTVSHVIAYIMYTIPMYSNVSYKPPQLGCVHIHTSASPEYPYTSSHVFQWRPFTLIRVLYEYGLPVIHKNVKSNILDIFGQIRCFESKQRIWPKYI